MADITETVVTSAEVNYTMPVYRQFGLLFLKIYATNKMLVVDTTEGKESIKLTSYPSLGITQIADTDSILEAAFTSAYDATLVIFEAV